MAQYSKTYKQAFDPDGLRVPDSRSLECQVLADIISNPDMIPTVRAVVNDSMFSVEAYRQLWTAINEMEAQGITVDLSTVCAKTDPGTANAILQKTGSTYTGTNDHCRLLVEMATRRLIFARAYDIMTKAGNPGSDFDRLLSMPGDLVADIQAATRIGAESQLVSDVLNDVANEVQDNQLAAASGKPTRVPTGFPMLDKLTFNGFKGGNLIVLSARPSVGKSAVMLQMAVTASRAGFATRVYSLEMTNTESGQRLLCSTGLVKQKGIVDGGVSWEDMERAIGQFDKLPLWFNDRCQTLDEICNDVVLHHQRGQCDIAFIDHLHRIRATDPRQSQYMAITERTGRFKSLAMGCKIPVVLLSQLNRLSESENRSPDLCDLRDSGSIEQDGDIILMMERASRSRDDNDLNIWVRKNRMGLAGNICIEVTGANAFTVFTERQSSRI